MYVCVCVCVCITDVLKLITQISKTLGKYNEHLCTFNLNVTTIDILLYLLYSFLPLSMYTNICSIYIYMHIKFYI